MEFYLIIFGILFSAILFGGFYFFYKKMSVSQKYNDIQKIFDILTQDREQRYRESESLRKELRDTTKNLQEQFFQVNKTVDYKLTETSKQFNEQLYKSSYVIGNLQKELVKIEKIGEKIENLDKILRSPKGRGSMGEENLEEILRSVFPNHLWERQFDLGHGLIVDAVVKTSSGMIPIDAKFPLSVFEHMIQSEDESALEIAQKEFMKNVKSRINEVAKYIKPEAGTMGFSILFLPNENIYYEAAIRFVDLAEYARSKHVLLTGPNTMLYVLQMLFQAYQSQQFAKEAKQALSQLTGIKKQAEKLNDFISVLAKHIGNANSKIGDVERENQKLQNQIDQVVVLQEY